MKLKKPKKKITLFINTIELKKGYTGRNCIAGERLLVTIAFLREKLTLFNNKSNEIFRDYKRIWSLFLRNRYRKRSRFSDIELNWHLREIKEENHPEGYRRYTA
jgi:hypothetical protein